MKPKIITLTTEEISGLFNLTAERLRQLAAAAHFPKPVRGKWDALAVAGGLVAYLQDRLKVRRTSPEYDKAREEKMVSEAKLSAMTLAEKEGKLLPRDAVLRVMSAHIIAARQILEQSSLTKPELQRVLRELASAKTSDFLKE